MKVKLLVFAALLLALASMSYAQGFCAFIYDDGFPIRDACTGGNPVPDGTVIYVYWDANSNGPDASDVLAPVCDAPPGCLTGPPGTVNFNTMTVNSAEWGFDPGEFFPDYAFCSVGMMTNPPRYYLVIPLPNGVTWTSRVMTFVSGPDNDTDLLQPDWSCVGNPCIPIPPNGVVDFPSLGHSEQHNETACIVLCHSNPTVTVEVLHIDNGQGHLPHVVASDNCTCAPAPATGYTWDMSDNGYGGWTWHENGTDSWWTKDITLTPGGTEGCVLLTFDWLLAASVTNVHAVAGDNSVTVSFQTLSETNMAGYEIRRGDQLVKRLDATNNATGSSYSYTDNSAVNGTVYTYSVVAVDMNGSRTSFPTESVAPSMLNAVVTEYALHQNFPNPFNPSTSIRFDLVKANNVTLKIYNANGQLVTTLVNGERKAGVNIVNFDASNMTSGLYFYTVKVGNVYSATKKMLLVK